MEKERRVIQFPVDVRANDEGQPVIEGYAALYGVVSDDLGGFREIIEPGAFADRLHDDVRALWQHDPLYVFGRTVSGTLELSEDEVGLRYRVEIPDAQWARDAVASIRRGDVNQSSFAFTVSSDQDQAIAREDGQWTRRIKRVGQLYDVSPVTFPAYQETSVAVRSQLAKLQEQEAGTESQDEGEVRVRQAARRREIQLSRGRVL